jgi:hypothetical protein
MTVVPTSAATKADRHSLKAISRQKVVAKLLVL